VLVLGLLLLLALCGCGCNQVGNPYNAVRMRVFAEQTKVKVKLQHESRTKIKLNGLPHLKG